MTEPLSFQCVCCGHSLNCHLTDGRWAACGADACPCDSWVGPDSRYDQCEAVLEGEPGLRCTLARGHHDKGIDHKNGRQRWLNEIRRVADSSRAAAAFWRQYGKPEPANHDHADDEACTSECTQVGGDHYVKRAIGPWSIWQEYGMNAFEGAVLKYLLRWKDKGGVEDLKKARHTLDRLIEIEESKGGTEAG